MGSGHNIGAVRYNIRGTMYNIIGTRDNNSSTFLKLEGGSGINKKINLIDIKICNIVT